MSKRYLVFVDPLVGLWRGQDWDGMACKICGDKELHELKYQSHGVGDGKDLPAAKMKQKAV